MAVNNDIFQGIVPKLETKVISFLVSSNQQSKIKIYLFYFSVRQEKASDSHM